MSVGLSSSQIIYWPILEEEYAMTMNICLEGTQKIRLVQDGGFRLTQPFVGTTGTGKNACLGIALRTIDSNGKIFWGPLGYYKIIRVWRAMKVLDMLGHIGDTTMVACWSLFHPETRSALDEKYIKELREQFGGEAGLSKVYNSILTSFPSSEDLNVLLSGVRVSGIHIDTDELLSEMKKQKMNVDTPAIKDLIERNPPKPPPLVREKTLAERVKNFLFDRK